MLQDVTLSRSHFSSLVSVMTLVEKNPLPAPTSFKSPTARLNFSYPHPETKMHTTRFARLILVATLALSLLGYGTATEEGAIKKTKKITTVEGITEYHLANGLRLLLYPDNSRPKVTVNMTVLVGSRHEGYGETGMAHLLEHMVFKGTPTHPHIPKALQEHGAQWNGTTSPDRTNYFETMPASDENLEFAIRLEADRLM